MPSISPSKSTEIPSAPPASSSAIIAAIAVARRAGSRVNARMPLPENSVNVRSTFTPAAWAASTVARSGQPWRAVTTPAASISIENHARCVSADQRMRSRSATQYG